MDYSDTRTPYEVLIRYDETGAPQGAHVQYLRKVVVDGELLKAEILPPEPIDTAGFPLSSLMSQTQISALARTGELEASVASLTNTLALQDAALSDAASTIAALQAEIADQAQTITAMTADVAQLSADKTALTGSLQAASATAETLRQQLTAAAAEIAALKAAAAEQAAY